MHEKVLPQHSLELLSALEADPSPLLSGWTLAGGTGLGFHLGHRVSEDLDFFRTDDMDVRALHDVLRAHGPYETLQEAPSTLQCATTPALHVLMVFPFGLFSRSVAEAGDPPGQETA